MVTLEKVCARNFMCFSNFDLGLRGKGLVGVLGENRDSSATSNNGAGKSAVFEAIYFGLFGKTLRGGRVDDVVKVESGEGMYVKVNFFDKDGKEYCIERYHKDKDEGGNLYFGRYDTHGPVDLRGEGKKETQGRIESILGMSSKLFQHVVLFGQGGMPRFSELGDVEKKELVEEILGTSLYKRAEKEARRRRSEASAELEVLRRETSLLGEQRAMAERRLQASLEMKESWENDRQGRIKRMEDKVREREAEVASLSGAEREALLKRVDSSNGRLSTLLEEKRSEDASMERMRSAYERKKADLTTEESFIHGTIQDLREKRSRMDMIVFEGKCPECGRPMKKEDFDFSSLERDEERARGEFKVVAVMMQELESAFFELSSEMGDKSRAIAESIEQCRKESFTLSSDLRGLDATIAALKNEIDGTRFELGRERSLTFGHDGEIQDAGQALEAISRRVTESGERMATLEGLLVKLEVLVEAFGPKGIRSFLFESSLGDLNERIDEYTMDVSDGILTARLRATGETAEGESRERITLDVVNLAGGPTYQLSSSGERRRLDLPVAFALQDVAASRGIGMGICLLDEVFENLDEEGVRRVVGLLSKASTRKFSGTMLVITHDEELKSSFPRIIRVVKEKGRSTVEA